MPCVVCGKTMPERDVCKACLKIPWKDRVKLLQLRRIADALESIDKKTKEKDKW